MRGRRRRSLQGLLCRGEGRSTKWLLLLQARKWSGKGVGPPTVTLLVRWWLAEEEKKMIMTNKILGER
jgi:hypothetical protein